MNDLDVAAYIDRGLEPERLIAIEDHLAYCEQCRENLIKAQELVAHSRRPRVYVRAAMMLATAAAIALIAIPSLRNSVTNRDSMRASGEAQPLVAYGPVGEIKSAPLKFTWASVRDALSYHITVTSDAGTEVWSASSADTTVVMPTSISLTVGSRYLWNVDAITADGNTRSTGTHEFGIVR